jgi:hypothetical protein
VKTVRSSLALREILANISSDPDYKTTRKGRPDFEPVLEKLDAHQAISGEVFSVALPFAADMALRAPLLLVDCTRLCQGAVGTVSLSRDQCASLLALALFGLLPNNVRATMRPLTFPKEGCDFLPNVEKLACLLHYFVRIAREGCGTGVIGVQRVVAGEPERAPFETRQVPLRKLIVKPLEMSLLDSSELAVVDFANASVGGGTLLNAPGSTAQEEILFATHPELVAALVLCDERMRGDEAVLVSGARRFSMHSGYSDTFRFLGPFVPISRSDTTIAPLQIAIDANMYFYL